MDSSGGPGARTVIRRLLRRTVLSENFVLYLSLVFFIGLYVFMPYIASERNLANISSNMWPLLALVLGQMFVLILGGIDLSQTSIMALTSVIGAMLMTTQLDPDLFTKSPLWGLLLSTDGSPLSGTTISFGQYGLMALEPAHITARQIEAGRIAMTRHVKRGGKIWIRMFPDKPITKKPAETRMGKGKGAPEDWVAVVKPGRILYEMEGVAQEVAQEAFRLAARKLPIRTRFVTREEQI